MCLAVPGKIIEIFERGGLPMGKIDEAVCYAESCRSPWASNLDIDGICEEILLSADRLDEAYTRYGPGASRAATHLATFRNVARKYPHRGAADILTDLVRTTPGEEGKWFAAAKDAGTAWICPCC